MKPRSRLSSEGQEESGSSGAKGFKKIKKSAAAPAPVASPPPIQPPARPDPASEVGARKEREVARGGGGGFAAEEGGTFGSVAQVVQHIETLKSSRLKKLNDSSKVVQDAGKKGVARIKLQAKALAETFTGHVQALSSAMPREAKAIFERARKSASRVPTGPLGAKTFVDTASDQLDQMKRKESALHAKAARGGKVGGAASTLLDRTHAEQTEAAEAEKLPLVSIDAAVRFAEFRLKLRINQIMRAKQTLLNAYRRVRDATIVQALTLGHVAADAIAGLAQADAVGLPRVADRVRIATGLVRRRFSSARGKFLETVSAGLGAQHDADGDVPWTAGGDPSAEGAAVGDAAASRPSWMDLRVRVCRLLHFALGAARSLGSDSSGQQGAGGGAAGGPEQDEWASLRQLVFAATQQDATAVDAEAKKAVEMQDAQRHKMQKAKSDAAREAEQAGAGTGGVASAASKFKSKVAAKGKKLGKAGGKESARTSGSSTVGSEKATQAAAEAGAKGKASSHAMELAGSYFSFPSVARMRRLRFQQGDAANAKKEKGAKAPKSGSSDAVAEQLGFDVTSDSPESASWLVLSSQ